MLFHVFMLLWAFRYFQCWFSEIPFAVGENVGVHEGPRSHAMGVDATPFVEPLLTSRALSFLSYHAEIPYSKGASLWHMLEAFWDSAGQDAFRVGPVLTPLHLFWALLGLFGKPFRVLE